MVSERMDRSFNFSSNSMMYNNDIPSTPPPLQPLHQRGAPPPPPAAALTPRVGGGSILGDDGLLDAFSPRGRRQREFIPDAKKDDCYWDRRRRNNEAAKRSREKRRLNDMLLERRVLELTKENWILKAQIRGVFEAYGIRAEETLSGISVDRILAAMPSNEHILAFGNRSSNRRDSMESDPSGSVLGFSDMCEDFSNNDQGNSLAKRPKTEIPDDISNSDDWSPSSSSSMSATHPGKCEDDLWAGVRNRGRVSDRETECEEEVLTPTPPMVESNEKTDTWGALNLTSSSNNSNSGGSCSGSDIGFESAGTMTSSHYKRRYPHMQLPLPPPLALATSSPPYSPYTSLPHKLRFKHSIDEAEDV